MHLKEARAKNKLAEFAKEHEKTHPRASHKHFHGVISSMAGQKTKPKKVTSWKGSRGN
jgi:hypothetical protein